MQVEANRLVRRILITAATIALMAVLGTAAAQAAAKVQICHLPPGNPDNFHTITVSDKALPAHLAHGDIAGSCFEAGEVLCNDDDACTIDAMDPATEECILDRPPVNCDDGLKCTVDSCDSASGCQYAPIVCDDGDGCTVDGCSEFNGECAFTPKDCGALGLCEPSSGECDFPCDGITCDPIDQCHEAGMCVLPGACVDGVPVADGTACDDGNAGTIGDQCTSGVCSGEVAAVCPCWTVAELPGVADGTTPQCGPLPGFPGDVSINGIDAECLASGTCSQQYDIAISALTVFGPPTCQYIENTHPSGVYQSRYILISVDEALTCKAQLEAECSARGF